MGACQSLLLGDGPIKAGPPSSTVAANQMPAQAATNKQSVVVRSRNIDSTNKISPPEEEIAEEIPEEIPEGIPKSNNRPITTDSPKNQPEGDVLSEIGNFFSQIFETQSPDNVARTNKKEQLLTPSKVTDSYTPPSKLDIATATTHKRSEEVPSEAIPPQRIERPYSAAYGVYQPLATKGHAFAQYEIGLMYLHGHGVANSLTEAKKWFRKAALQGHPGAKTELGNLMSGSGAKVANAPKATGVKEPTVVTKSLALENPARKLANATPKLITPKDPKEEEPPTVLITSKSITKEISKPDEKEPVVIDRILPRQDLPDLKKDLDPADLTKENGDLTTNLFEEGEKAPPPPNADDPRGGQAPVKTTSVHEEAATPTQKKIVEDKPAKQYRKALAPETAASEPPGKKLNAPPVAPDGVSLVEPEPAPAEVAADSLATAPPPEDAIKKAGIIKNEEDNAVAFNKGLAAYNAGNFKKAYTYWRPLAQQGEAESQTRMGYLFEHGKGVEKNYQQAVDWYQKAATQGEPAAQFNLGVMYRKGRGVNKDDKVARQWYEKAAGQGHPIAERVVEVMKAYKIGE